MATNGGGMYLLLSNPTLTNTINWDNSLESISLHFGNEQPFITYSDIEGGWEGEGNIDLDPLFTDPDNDDYTLQEGSPCIDSGIVIEDMEYCGEAPDMGAYEYLTEDCLGCTDENACNYDETVIQEDGSCEYPEEGFDCDGNELSLTNNIPVKYQFNPVFPNPFNPTTTISFSIPQSGIVSLNIYDITGKLVKTLINEQLNIGYHSIDWDGTNQSSGMYLVRMESGEYIETQKLLLVK